MTLETKSPHPLRVLRRGSFVAQQVAFIIARRTQDFLNYSEIN